MYDMLVNGDPRSFKCREIAYEVEVDEKSNTYIRYNAYENAEEFRKNLEKINPIKIDIGPVHSAPVRIPSWYAHY